MKILSRSAMLSAGLLLAGVAANAQVWGGGPYRNDPYYRGGNDPYYRNGGGYRNDGYYGGRGNPGGDVIGRVLSDLNRANSASYGDRKHFERAQQRLYEFQDRWRQGRFDNGKLDKAIEDIQHLVNSNQLRGRDRQILADDLYALRSFRSSGGSYGNYGGRGPYGNRW